MRKLWPEVRLLGATSVLNSPHTAHRCSVCWCWHRIWQSFLPCLFGGCSQPKLLLVSLWDNLCSSSCITFRLTSNVMAFLHLLSEPSWRQCFFLLSNTFKYLKRLNAVLFLFTCPLLPFFSLTQALFHPQCAAPCPAGDPARKDSHDATCTGVVTLGKQLILW